MVARVDDGKGTELNGVKDVGVGLVESGREVVVALVGWSVVVEGVGA